MAARGGSAGPRGAAGTLPSPLPSPPLAAAAGAGSALGPAAPADADRAHLTPLPPRWRFSLEDTSDSLRALPAPGPPAAPARTEPPGSLQARPRSRQPPSHPSAGAGGASRPAPSRCHRPQAPPVPEGRRHSSAPLPAPPPPSPGSRSLPPHFRRRPRMRQPPVAGPPRCRGAAAGERRARPPPARTRPFPPPRSQLSAPPNPPRRRQGLQEAAGGGTGLTSAATAWAVGAPSRQPAPNRAGLLPPGPRWPTSALTPRGFQTRASQSAGGGESGASSRRYRNLAKKTPKFTNGTHKARHVSITPQ